MQIRTLFSSSGIGIDTFKLSREQHASRYAPSLGKYLFNYFSYFIFLNSDGFKKRFLDSIGQSNSQIFTEDLRNMIMSANNDQEIDAVIQALKRYLFEKISLKILRNIYIFVLDIVQIKLNLQIIILVHQ